MELGKDDKFKLHNLILFSSYSEEEEMIGRYELYFPSLCFRVIKN